MTLDSIEEPRDERYLVPGLARGLQILGCFIAPRPRADRGRALSPAGAATRLGVSGMLHTLEQTGLCRACGVTAQPTSSAWACCAWALSSWPPWSSPSMAGPVIEELRDAVWLFCAPGGARRPRGGLCRQGRQAPTPMFHSIQVGARLPAHATVLGRALLSGLDMAELRRALPRGAFARLHRQDAHHRGRPQAADGRRPRAWAMA